MALARTWHHAAMTEPATFTVRRATPADIPALVDLRIAFDRELAGPLPAERADEHRAAIETYLRLHVPDGRYRMWVADAAGEGNRSQQKPDEHDRGERKVRARDARGRVGRAPPGLPRDFRRALHGRDSRGTVVLLLGLSSFRPARR